MAHEQQPLMHVDHIPYYSFSHGLNHGMQRHAGSFTGFIFTGT